MSKFLIVKNPPQNLEKGEFVIDQPDFYKEIRASRAKKPRSHALTVNYFREVMASIATRYLSEGFDHMTTINANKYVGTPCTTEEQVHATVIKALETYYPQLLLAYNSHCFKQRPSGTSFIFYSGNPNYAIAIKEFGWEQLTDKEYEAFRSGKPKKIVGKSAITDAEAALLNH